VTRKDLFKLILDRKSYLCVGLDTDLQKIPTHLRSLPYPLLEFNKSIIDATRDLCVAYKPNLAFYESLGSMGWDLFKQTVEYIGDSHFVIADAKRGDIGNTSKMYAKAFFEHYQVDAITVAPYMGEDSVGPFLEWNDKWVILLALTSNIGSIDFQMIEDENGKSLFKKVLETSSNWGSTDNLMYVVGATHPEAFKEIRSIVPDHFLLVPGVGAQGGDLEKVSEFGMNNHCGLLINSSRGIIYAGSGQNYAEEARNAALGLQQKMAVLLESRFS